MGIDALIQNNNPNWDNNVTFIKINKEICRSMKEINKALKKELDDKKFNKNIKQDNDKAKAIIKEKELKKEEEKKNKKNIYYKNKLESNNYNLMVVIFSFINKNIKIFSYY